MARRGALAAALLAATTILASCASGAMTADVDVSITSSGLHLSQTTYDRQGPISFNIDNSSGQYRNLLIIRYNHVSSLPLKPDGTVDTGAVSLADQVDVLAPGRYHLLSPDLTNGTYLFVTMPVRAAAGTPIIGNQRYIATVSAVGPYRPQMSARFVVSGPS